MDQKPKLKFNIESSLLPWLGRTMKALDFYIADEFAKHGLSLTKAQMILLKVLTKNDGMPQNNLAFITNRDKTSLTRLIHTMEKKGFVKRESSDMDRRINLVFITQKGMDTLDEAFPILEIINKKIETGINKSSINDTIMVLKQISQNINADYLTAPLTNSK